MENYRTFTAVEKVTKKISSFIISLCFVVKENLQTNHSPFHRPILKAHF